MSNYDEYDLSAFSSELARKARSGDMVLEWAGYEAYGARHYRQARATMHGHGHRWHVFTTLAPSDDFDTVTRWLEALDSLRELS